MALDLTPLEKEKFELFPKPYKLSFEIYNRQETITVFGYIPNPVQYQVAVRLSNGREDRFYMDDIYTAGKWFASENIFKPFAKAANKVLDQFFHDVLVDIA